MYVWYNYRDRVMKNSSKLLVISLRNYKIYRDAIMAGSSAILMYNGKSRSDQLATASIYTGCPGMISHAIFSCMILILINAS